MDKILFVARREVGAYFNSPVAYVVVMLFLLITGALFWIPYFQEISVLSLRGFFAQAPLFLAFFAPAITMGLLAGEKRAGTLELLMTMPVSAYQVVLGKFLAALFLLAVVFVMTLPYPYTLSLLGDLDWGSVAAGYLGLLLLGGAYLSIGLMASSWTRDQVVAILAAFSISFFLFLVDQIIGGEPTGLSAQVLEYLSTSYHFRSIARGLLDARNVVFYLSLIGLSLTLTVVSVELRGRALKKSELKGQLRWIGIGTAAVIGAVLLNLGFSQTVLRWDLTANKIYTLSPVSLEAVEGLEEPVEVVAFISPNLPAPFHNLRQQVEEILMEYQAASRGNFTYRVLVPEESEDVERLARSYGLDAVAISQESEREVSFRAVFKGMAFVQGDRVEVIENLPVGAEFFEYEFTRSLIQVQERAPRRVGFVVDGLHPAGEGEYMEILGYIFGEYFGGLLDVESVRLSESGDGVDVDALVFLGVDEDLSAEALFALDQYIQGGGAVGWFQDGGTPDLERAREVRNRMIGAGNYGPFPQFQKPLGSNLIDFFAALGLEFNSDAVIDRERALAYGIVETERGAARVSHPATFPITNMDRNVSFTRHFSTVSMPAPATVTIGEKARRPGVEAYEVLRTAETSLRWPRPPATMSLQEMMREDIIMEPGSYLVAAALEGKVASYYEEAPLPEGRRELDLIGAPEDARILVVGSSSFLFEYPEAGYDPRLALVGMQFFLTAVEWLAQDGSLSEIRTKSMPRYLTDVPPEAQRSIRFINIFVVPVLFAVIGVFMMIRRRKRRESLE